jgi:hypothetical protein
MNPKRQCKGASENPKITERTKGSMKISLLQRKGANPQEVVR